MMRIICLTLLMSAGLHGAFCQTSSHTIKTIVIDPGHGGEDAGCHGVYSFEKNVALQISLKVGDLMKKNYPGVKIIYTRTTDKFVGLEDRAKMANDSGADLFLCIHCNASTDKTAYGTETYLMGLHKSEGNLEVSQRENSVITYEKDYETKYDGFDPDSPEAYIMFSLNQNAHIDECIYLCSAIENEFKTDSRFSRGVKQAGFWVLWRTTMPSILCETGFLTNPTEEKYMTCESGQNEIADGIYQGLKKYKLAEESENFSLDDIGAGANAGKTSIYKTMISGNTTVITPQPKDTTKIKTDTTKKIVQQIGSTIIYKIQIYSSTTPMNLTAKPFSGITDIEDDKTPKGFHRYVVGKYSSLTDATKRQSDLKAKGFKDCFVVTYKNGVRQN